MYILNREHRHQGKYQTHSPNGRIIYKRNPKHKHMLSKRHRKIFQRLDKEPYEVGGYMDFDLKGLERADVYPGRRASVEFDITPDKEVEYHTHSKSDNRILNRMNAFPSKMDINSFQKTPTQAMMIFNNSKATVISKMDDFKVKPKILDKIESGLYKDAPRMDTMQLFRKYVPEYGKMGLDIRHIRHTGAIKMPIDVVEPVKKYKIRKESWLFPHEAGVDPRREGETTEGRFLFERDYEE